MFKPEMNSDCRAAIVIPCLNEGTEIETSMRSMVEAVDRLDDGAEVEVAYVDGSSSDCTLEAIRDIGRGYDNVYVIDQPRPGIGNARQKGVRYMLDRALHRDRARHDDFWVISTDADVVVPGEWLNGWMDSFDAQDGQVRVGSSRFPDWFGVKYPNAHEALNVVSTRMQRASELFGPINLDGTNSAIERTAYATVGPFRQPYRTSNSGSIENLAGEDWDMGTRARMLGISVVAHVADPVVISPRRFEADVTAFLTGEAYEKEFLRVDADDSRVDIRASSIPDTIRIVTYRQVMHAIGKPLLVEPNLLEDHSVRLFLGEKLTRDMKGWIQITPRPDMFTNRNAFILDYLGAFHEQFGVAISECF